MCNCNQNQIESSQHSENHETSYSSQRANAIFKYIGNTALTLIGGYTNRRYRFEKPGDVQMIDYKDITGILHIPVLVKV